MKKILSICFCAILGLSILTIKAEDRKTVNIFKEVVFYDDYQPVVVDADIDDGIIRFKNSLYSVKLDSDALADMGDDMQMDVVIGALCDNYDRLGTVCLAFVPKGQETYDFDNVQRIEITRFITPFMNKNRQPDEVPYNYEIANVGRILRDNSLRSKYDFWMEFEVFGIPYAANTQVAGCNDRNDVFEGTIDLAYTPSTSYKEDGNIIVPIYVKKPEDHGNVNFNNYKEGATDTLGVTTRTFEFEVPEDVSDSRIYLILTNHGANTDGEEYIRRLHLVYFDGDILLSYTPGGVSCEPYRKYNTQPNGIYSTSRPDISWILYSNWCPGQAVPIRELHIGQLTAGKHKVMIRVPDAQFVGKDGDFRPSLYFHGVKEGELKAGVTETWMEGPIINICMKDSVLSYVSDEKIAKIYIHSYDGQLLTTIDSPDVTVNLRPYVGMTLIMTFVTPEGRTTVRKVIV